MQLLIRRVRSADFRFLVAAVYFLCAYWMDQYNLLRLFAVRKHSNDKVGSGIVFSKASPCLDAPTLACMPRHSLGCLGYFCAGPLTVDVSGYAPLAQLGSARMHSLGTDPTGHHW